MIHPTKIGESDSFAMELSAFFNYRQMCSA